MAIATPKRWQFFVQGHAKLRLMGVASHLSFPGGTDPNGDLSIYKYTHTHINIYININIYIYIYGSCIYIYGSYIYMGHVYIYMGHIYIYMGHIYILYILYCIRFFHPTLGNWYTPPLPPPKKKSWENWMFRNDWFQVEPQNPKGWFRQGMSLGKLRVCPMWIKREGTFSVL